MSKKIQLKDKVFKPYIKHEKIIEAIDNLAAKLNEDNALAEDVPIMLCVLNGAILFTAELLQKLNFNCELASIKLSSYQGTQSTGEVLNVLSLSADVKGRRVVICEDIVDTGNTITALKQKLLETHGAAEVKVCTLFHKPDVYDKPEKLDYVGFCISNEFIVGFGLDYDELGRNFKDVYILD